MLLEHLRGILRARRNKCVFVLGQRDPHKGLLPSLVDISFLTDAFFLNSIISSFPFHAFSILLSCLKKDIADADALMAMFSIFPIMEVNHDQLIVMFFLYCPISSVQRTM